MLTESEIDWLRRRSMSSNPYCGWCMKYALCCSPQFTKCPTKTADLGDALEFEGRVVAKLADPYFPSMDKGSTFECGLFIMPSMDRLRCARIDVEEEMNVDQT